MTATVDTGSQVTTLSEAWYREHLSARRDTNPDIRWLRLSAANGQAIDSVGYLEVDLVVRQQVIPNCPIIVIRSETPSRQPACLLGMNILRRLKDCPDWLRTPLLTPKCGLEGGLLTPNPTLDYL